MVAIMTTRQMCRVEIHLTGKNQCSKNQNLFSEPDDFCEKWPLRVCDI